jgi:hypothetical protein
MNRQRRKRILAGTACFILSFTLNVNPVATICGAIADSGIVDKCGIIKDNLIYLARNSGNVTASASEDDDNSLGSTYTFECDATDAISTIMGTGSITMADLNNNATAIKDAIGTTNTDLSGIQSTLNSINSTLSSDDDKVSEAVGDAATSITTAISDAATSINSNFKQNLQLEFQTVNGNMESIIEISGNMDTSLSTISKQLDDMTQVIENMQHNYKVAHVYSLNNTYSNCLWKPASSDIPYLEDFVTVTGKFASVYTGYWDTGITTLNNPNNSRTTRAQEILGYDIIVRAEGLILQTNVAEADTTATGLSGNNQSYVATDGESATASILSYYQELIPEDNICWIDAVTVLYRALGQEQISYQSFMSKDTTITPESSPVFTGLSNPVAGDDGYNGWDFYMFMSRSNIISKTIAKSGEDSGTATMDYIYWSKAINAGFIPSEYAESAREPITFSEFFQLATRMMQAYGEPVMNDSELKALLQVYGTHYPIQLGTDIADAWAYLAARGILDFNEYTEGNESILYDISYTGYITRDQLLTMAMRIADEDSRTDYKTIDIVLNLSDVMQEDYYYPVYDMSISNGQFATSSTYDHAASSTYDYLLCKTNEVTLGTTGTPVVMSKQSTDISEMIDGSAVSVSTITLTDGTEWYKVSVPKTYTGNFYVTMHVEGDTTMQDNTVTYLEIPSSALGGGYFSKYTISGDDDNKVATVTLDSGYYLTFDKKSEYATRNCTDYIRAGEDKPKASTETSSNATVLETLSAKLTALTTPMSVNAATLSIDDDDAQLVHYSSEASWRVQIYAANANVNSTSKQTLTSLADYNPVKYNLITGYTSDSAFVTNSTVSIPSSADVKLLNRLSTIYEYGTRMKFNYIGDNNGTMVSFIQSSLMSNSLLTGFQAYFHADDSTSLNSKFWDTLREKSKSSFSSSTRRTSNVDAYTVEKTYNTFLTQFLLGMYPESYMADYTDNSNNQQVSVAFDSTNYSAAVSGDYKAFLKENLTKFYSSSDDTYISNLISQGIIGATYNGSAYTVYGTESALKAVSEDLGEIAADTSTDADTSESATSIETSVATTTIMDRNQQILISWSDMVASGYVVVTTSDGQPKLRDNGAYYFMTTEGQVIVNDTQHTIQIGNTLYDLMYDNGSAPTLVYIDSEQDNEMYFDYRCVMGIVRNSYTVNDTKTETFQSNLGVADCVIYDLDTSGVSSDWFNTVDVACYNYPEVSSITTSDAVSTSAACSLNMIKSTIYDGESLDGYTYWEDSSDISRLRLSTFVPTANYLCFIKDTEDGAVAQLYVYYLRTAFENGFVDKGSDTKQKVSAPEDADTRWSDLASKVEEASLSYTSSTVSLKQQLKNVYGYDADDESMPWYLKMTYDAIANLYSYTGKYYFSADYVIRRFDLTDQSISNCCGWNTTDETGNTNVALTSNDAGAIYWVDSIGYIYNLPSNSEFTLKKYLEGEYLLPLALDTSNSANPKIINYNLNYYGTAVKFKDNTRKTGKSLPYGVTLSDKSDSPYIRIDGTAYKGITTSDVAKLGDQYTDAETTTNILPFLQKFDTSLGVTTTYEDSSSVNYFIPAPTGIYNKFGGNSLETIEINDITQYVTDATKVYYGSTQVKLNSSTSDSTTKLFNFVSTKYNPIALDGATKAYRVYRSSAYDVLIIEPSGITVDYGSGVSEIEIDDYYTNPLEDWLDGLGTSDILTAIDTGASFLIIFAFKVLPMIGIILMTILIGLSFVGDIKIVQILCDKFIDPVRVLTFGGRNIANWNWRKVLLPCILLYLAFALFLNGNLIRIIMWGAEWYGTIMKWAKTL